MMLVTIVRMSPLPAAPLSSSLATDPVQRPTRSLHLRDLPARREGPSAAFQRLNAPVGGSCVRDCDCAEGLVCRAGSCVADW